MNFWQGKRVFITGHTGFKGSWLCLMLNLLGARVTGYALKPPTNPNLFKLCKIAQLVDSVIADIRDNKRLNGAMRKAKPQIVIHLAAQPIVRESYKYPAETFSINVIGTVNVLEAARGCKSVKAIVNVTTDKVYENQPQVASRGSRVKAFSENDKLGGYDPYSASKACSELVSQAYRRSYGMKVATARAGNVIGGGDWAVDRLIPDFVRAILNGEKIKIRNPGAVRPWQHVLEPLSGYILLAEKLYKYGSGYAAAYNFGPAKSETKSVEWLAQKLSDDWDGKAGYVVAEGKHPHEAHYLELDSAKARREIGWRPKWGIDLAVKKVVAWSRAYQNGEDSRELCLRQIGEYLKA